MEGVELLKELVSKLEQANDIKQVNHLLAEVVHVCTQVSRVVNTEEDEIGYYA
jgi:hypothetical protein